MDPTANGLTERARTKKNGEFGINGILIKSGNNLLVKIKFRHWWYRLQPENHSYISLMMNLKKKNKTETENETATDSAFLQITNHKSHLSYIRNEHILICTHFNKSSFLQQTTVKYIYTIYESLRPMCIWVCMPNNYPKSKSNTHNVMKLIALFCPFIVRFFLFLCVHGGCLLFYWLENRNLTTNTLSEMKGMAIKSMHNNYKHNTHNDSNEDIHLLRTEIKILRSFATVSW